MDPGLWNRLVRRRGRGTREGMSGNDVTVRNAGGDLRVTLEGDEATLSGPVQFVANVEWLEA